MKTATSHMTPAQILHAEHLIDSCREKIFERVRNTGKPVLTATQEVVRETFEPKDWQTPVGAWALRMIFAPETATIIKNRIAGTRPRSIWDQFWSAMS